MAHNEKVLTKYRPSKNEVQESCVRKKYFFNKLNFKKSQY